MRLIIEQDKSGQPCITHVATFERERGWGHGFFHLVVISGSVLISQSAEVLAAGGGLPVAVATGILSNVPWNGPLLIRGGGATAAEIAIEVFP